jgi:hypothetical protein
VGQKRKKRCALPARKKKPAAHRKTQKGKVLKLATNLPDWLFVE